MREGKNLELKMKLMIKESTITGEVTFKNESNET